MVDKKRRMLMVLSEHGFGGEGLTGTLEEFDNGWQRFGW